MHGGDSLFGRMTSVTHVYRETSGLDAELDHKAHKVTEKLSESINTIANEPSVAFYRIQEHVRKTLPQLVEQKHEVEEVQQLVQGACFDTEYAANAVKGMQKSVVHFQNIQELLKNAMFMKQQIDYEEARKRQSRVPGGNGRQEGHNGAKVEDSNSNMDDSAISTDSSLVASGHTNTEEDRSDCTVEAGVESAERKVAEEDNTEEGKADTAEREDKGKDATEKKDRDEAKDTTEREDTEKGKNTTERKDSEEGKDMTEREDTEKGKDTTERKDSEEGKDTTEREDTEKGKDLAEVENTQEWSGDGNDTNAEGDSPRGDRTVDS